jgi:hypothetical protein
MVIESYGSANPFGLTDLDPENSHFFLDSDDKMFILCQRNYYYEIPKNSRGSA